MNTNKILESPFFQSPKAWWIPYFTLCITLFGICFLHWNLKPIVFLFWWEIILIVSSALLRMLFALDGQPFFKNIIPKIGTLIAGFVMGGALIMLSVVFTFSAFSNGDDYSGLANISIQTTLMTAGYVVGLAIHYFGNGRYKNASPMGELALPFVHILVLLAFLQVFTMHLIPKYPELNQAMWVALSLVFVKFMADLLFSKIGKPLQQTFETPEVKS